MSMKKLTRLMVGQSIRFKATPEILRFLEENNKFRIIKRESRKNKTGFSLYITVEKIWDFC